MNGIFTVDVEDWFHVLDTPVAPELAEWDRFESRIERGLRTMLELFGELGIKATLFWLGWAAERHRGLVAECHAAGHEIASHGHAHVLTYAVGREGFRDDVRKAKAILEDIIGVAVAGYRAPGFSITAQTPWAFEVLAEAGYRYDASVFPVRRGHGGMPGAPRAPHVVRTRHGLLDEVAVTTVKLGPVRLPLFGGGYLRLAPAWLLRWGVQRVRREGLPLVVYIHPREIDPHHPRLVLPVHRRFKCYYNLRTTRRKLSLLGQQLPSCMTMHEWLANQSRVRPVVFPESERVAGSKESI